MAWETPEPLQALKTWAWTWWPMWPIVAVLWCRPLDTDSGQLPHIQLVSALVGVISLMALLGPGLADSRLFLPVGPLAILAAFGLLSMPRSPDQSAGLVRCGGLQQAWAI